MEIQNYPNYLIYRDGRVQNKKTNRFLKPYLTGSKNKSQYDTVKLFNGENKQNHRVHRLVAIHYIPNPNNYETVDHKDRNTRNNDISNLRWANYKMQRNNQKEYPIIKKTNTSGFRYIKYDKSVNRWIFDDELNKIYKSSVNKIDMICFKFIHNLRVRCNNYKLRDNVQRNNKSGHKNIFYEKTGNRWRFYDNKRKITKSSKNKINMICYKYIHNLRIKAGHYQ